MSTSNGTSGNDFVLGTTDVDNLQALAGDDLVLGLDEKDQAEGGPGQDFLDGNIGDDTIFGGSGSDTVRGGKNNDNLFAEAGNDTVLGDLGNDTGLGEVGRDILFGNQGLDWLAGNEDNDSLHGGKGNDTLRGGRDNDQLLGELDDDVLAGDLGDDVGSAGTGTDILFGNQGADWLGGNEQNDSLYGGKENDTLHGGQDNDQLFGELDDDVLAGDLGDDIALGEVGNDYVFGNQGTDWVAGNEGNDTIYGGMDNDTGHGGKDNDMVCGDLGDDVMHGDLGDDLVCGGAGTDVLYGNEGNDWIGGNENEDTLHGGTGNDSLFGGMENDFIYGEEGNDVLAGDIGADTVFGNNGNDTFIIGRRNDVPGYRTTGGPELSDADWFLDFGSDDVISLIGGLTAAELNIFAGTEAYAGYTIIQDNVLGEYLAIIRGTQPNSFVRDTYQLTYRPTSAPADGGDGSPADGGDGSPVVPPPVDSGGGVIPGGGGGTPGGGGGTPGGGGGTPGGGGGTPGGGGGTPGGGNTAPVAVNDAVTTDEDVPVTLPNVLINDTDADGNPLTITGSTNPANGTVVNNGDGTFVYTPTANFNGTDSFNYTVSDPQGTTDTGTVTITVNPINDAPVASAGNAFTTTEDTPVQIPNLLANITDPDGDPLTVTQIGTPQNGTLTPNEDGTYTYTPTPNFNGTDSFTYTVSDGKGGTTTNTVTINVGDQNDGPVAVADAVTTDEDVPVTLPNVLTNDTDGDGGVLTITGITNPANGTVVNNGDGTFVYTPAANFNGTDSFNYTVSDPQGTTDTGTVTITVNPINDAPAFTGDNGFTTNENTPVQIPNLLTNFTDPDGDPVSVTQIGVPQNGTLTPNEDGTYTYTPAPNFSGTDSFTYTVSDGKGGTTTNTVTIDVADGGGTPPVNAAPVAVADAVATDEDVPVTISNVLINDTDADGDALTITGNTNPANGTVVSNGDGTFVYTPAANFNGTDSFNYTVSDPQGATAAGTVTITVNPVNDAPTISDVADQFTTPDTPTGPIPFTIGDVDTELANLTVTATSSNPALVADADITLIGTGPERKVTVTPIAGQVGTTTITLAVSDGVTTTTDTFNLAVYTPIAPNDITRKVLLSSPLQITPAELLANDIDPIGQGLTITAVSDAVNGTVAMDPQTGLITFQAIRDFSGLGSFTYTVQDSNGGTATATVTVPITPVVELASIATNTNVPVGTGGFPINGETPGDNAGNSVSGIGDLNGDGLTDMIVATNQADPDGLVNAGKAYVVYGKADPAPINLTDVNAGIGGFAISGEAENDQAGHEVSGATDFNGDGVVDVIIGARYADVGALGNAGKAYIVYGKTDGIPVALSQVAAGTGGAVLLGQAGADQLGNSVSEAGDVNGDGIGDVIIGAPSATVGATISTGKSYVVFGRANGTAPSISDVVAGIGGFVINGEAVGDQSGQSVRSAGDVNGDGLADVIVGAPLADVAGVNDAGKAYVVFGKADGTAVSLANVTAGTGGFVINGIDPGTRAGRSVSGAGDVNGDGFSDLVIGARGTNNTAAGNSYVVFGKAEGTAVNLTAVEAGTGGFVINGEPTNDTTGRPVRSAGDINADGLADIILGASIADVNGPQSGKAYVIFGKTGTEALNLNEVATGMGGFAINGESPQDLAGTGVRRAGDVNGDGFLDVIVGAPGTTPNNAAGRSYVVHGGDFTGSVTQQGGAGADVLTGTAAADVLVGGGGNDTLTGAGGADVLYGGPGNDILGVSDGSFIRVDGGTGTDTLRLDGAGFNLDLAAISNIRMSSIEQIDLTGAATNSLGLTRLELFALTDTNKQLIVNGIAGNVVSLQDQGWTLAGQSALNGITYNQYSNGNASLLMDTDITVQNFNQNAAV